MSAELENILSQFALDDTPTSIAPLRGGLINDSYVVGLGRQGDLRRVLLQRINGDVFPHPPSMMDNIQRVTRHLARRLQELGVNDRERKVLTVVQTIQDRAYHVDDDGYCWRMYHFIEGSTTREVVETPRQAEQAGRAFGMFQSLLVDLPDPELHETIPAFHDTPSRFSALDHALAIDAHGRASTAQVEIKFSCDYRPLATALLDPLQNGDLQMRIAHNDAKISNVLFDRATDEGICVVDLDTVMPGLALYDFGDMVRSMTCRAAEDERDLSRVAVDMPLFTALTRGFVEATAGFLTAAERAHLVTAGQLMALEQGVRFLTDYLGGDTYYRTEYPDQNLIRCRTQFKLLESMIRDENRLRQTVESM
ncbi:MAG: phosphotransferase enzyme family protein [Planctomycetota bacterium]|jgi:Ser/Thr protein kinase RdoA (MazF antagonist)